MELFKLFGTIAINGLDKASDGLEKLSGKAKAAGEKITSVGKKVTDAGKLFAPVTAAVGGLAVASAKASMSFEDAMAKVSTIADTTKVPLSDLQTAIMDLSDQTGISSSEIANNVYDAISAGQETGDAVNFVSRATQLAKAGFAETGDALDILSTIMNAYGLEADKVTDVSDMLIQTQNKGKTTVAELSSAMGRVIPTANAFKVNLDQVCTSYAIMTANGINTAETTTYLNGMLNELGKSGTTVSDVIKNKTGKSFSDLMADGSSLGDVLEILQSYAEETGVSMSDLWSSSEAGKAALTLAKDGAQGFNDVLDGMQKSVGSTEEAFGKLQTNSFSMKKTMNELKNTGIEFGNTIMEMLAPYISKVSEKVHELSEWFKGLDDSEKKQIVWIGIMVAAIAPLLLGLGKTITTVGTVTKAFGNVGGAITKGITHVKHITEAFKLAKAGMTGFALQTSKVGTALAGISAPMIAIVATIGVLVAAFITLWNTNEKFRNGVIAIWNNLKQSFDDMCSRIVAALNSLGFNFSSVTEVIRTVWQGLCDFLEPAITLALTLVQSIFSAAFEAIAGIVEFFVALFNNDWEGMWNAVKSILQAGADFITNVFNAIATFLSSIGSKIWSIVADKFENVRSSIANKVNAAKQTVQSAFENIQSTISNKIESAKGAVSSSLETIRSAFSDKLNSAQSTVSSIFDSIKSKIESVMDSAKSTVQGAIDRIKSAFNFSWSLPPLKLPHVSISGKFSLNPPSVPHFDVEWYRKAMDNPLLMTRPTAFGINNLGQVMAGGEAGAEVVSGADTLMNMISDAVESKNSELIDILKAILKAIFSIDDSFVEKMRQALEGMSFDLNNREFARLVRAVK